MTEASRARFAEVVRSDPVDLALACLLIGTEVEPELALEPYLAELDRLAAAVDPSRPPVEGLRAVLGGFTGDGQDYGDLRSSLLHEVLSRRAGLPILLSVVWLEVARRRGIDADGIGLPGHFIVRIDGRTAGSPGSGYVDPFSGGAGFDVSKVAPEYLRPWQAPQTLLRILTNIRVWAGEVPDRARTRLWAVELSLLLPHHPADLRHERGVLLAAGGDFLAGAAELDAYADAVATTDASAAARVRQQALAARARLN